jgi:hypothetical protein
MHGSTRREASGLGNFVDLAFCTLVETHRLPSFAPIGPYCTSFYGMFLLYGYLCATDLRIVPQINPPSWIPSNLNFSVSLP